MRHVDLDSDCTGHDEGFTLIELLVVMALLGVITVVVTTAMVSTTQAVGKARKQNQQSDQVRGAFEAMAKSLRSAVRYNTTTSPFLVTGTTVAGKVVANNGREMWFYSNRGAMLSRGQCGPEVVHYYVDSSSQLIEERTLPDSTSAAGSWTYTGAPKFRRVLTKSVVVPAPASLFTYYSNLASPALNGADSLATLPDATSGSVGNVVISVGTRTTGNQGASSAQTQAVRLVNADAPAGSGAGC